MSKAPTITFHDFPNAFGEPVYAFKVHCRSDAERKARVSMEEQMPSWEAYVPNAAAIIPKSDTPFDPPEEPAWPSDATAGWYPRDSGKGDFPPPCDGNNAGTVLANAQFEAAVDGDECTSGVCLAVRGAND